MTTAHPVQRGTLERVLAALVTGPVGHLYSVLCDLAEFALTGALRKQTRSPRPPHDTEKSYLVIERPLEATESSKRD